jgi:hypoxanthine phosphoribosyltransferase
MKVKDIALSGLEDYSMMLARKVSEAGYSPDHVLYIERVGLFPGHEVAKYFNCSISGVLSSRSGTSIKSKAKLFLRYLPRPLTHFLRYFELRSNIHAVKADRNVSVEGKFPPKGKALLIVDDAVDTGYSLKAVYDYMVAHGYDRSRIKSAVLTTTRENPVWRPDISLFEQTIFALPWSYDSREYDECWERYKYLKRGIS